MWFSIYFLNFWNTMSKMKIGRLLNLLSPHWFLQSLSLSLSLYLAGSILTCHFERFIPQTCNSVILIVFEDFFPYRLRSVLSFFFAILFSFWMCLLHQRTFRERNYLLTPTIFLHLLFFFFIHSFIWKHSFFVDCFSVNFFRFSFFVSTFFSQILF